MRLCTKGRKWIVFVLMGVRIGSAQLECLLVICQVLCVHKVLDTARASGSAVCAARTEGARRPSFFRADGIKVSSGETACECAVEPPPAVVVVYFLLPFWHKLILVLPIVLQRRKRRTVVDKALV